MVDKRVPLWVAVLLAITIVGCGSAEDNGMDSRAVVPLQTGAGSGGPGATPAFGGPAQPDGSGAIGGGQPQPSMNPGIVIENPAAEPGGECGEIKITPVVEFRPGNLLIIMDRSISMASIFDMASNSNRLDNAKHAIMTALQPLVCPPSQSVDAVPCTDAISVALLTFPTYDGATGLDLASLSCSVDDLSSQEQINWQGVSTFVQAFPPYWDARTPVASDGLLFPAGNYPLVYGTPISVAFARANEALNAPNVVGNKAVLFLTDGEETGMCGGGMSPPQLAQQWNDMGIKTHVVSLAPPMGFGVQFNNQVASNGGTNMPINPMNSAQLTEEISQIVLDSRGEVACEVTIEDAMLTDAQMACDGGTVIVGPTKVPCDQQNKAEGFFVKDEKTFEIAGSYCTMYQETMMLTAEFPCELITIE